MTNFDNQKKGGYENLVVYHLATQIYDLTVVFCGHFIDKKSRTFDQMVQAARSGKQNIVEGSLEKSFEGNLKLTGIARASFGELLEDYKDFLRQRNLPLWVKEDPRVLAIRRRRIIPHEIYETNETYVSHLKDGESFANLLITLCFKEGFLLDRLLASVEEKFVKEGGFRENLFRKRLEFKKGENR